MKNRKFVLLLLVCGMIAGGAAPLTAAEITADHSGNNFANMGRGLVNIATCFLELPRCLVYRNSQVPVLGLIAGACEGAGLTGVRAVAGLADFLSSGFMSDAIYRGNADFQEWVWESPWTPKY